MLNPDLYFEAYTDGSLIIENGSLTDFLEITKILEGDINFYSKIFNKIILIDILQILIELLTQKNVSHHYDISEKLYDLFLDKKRQYSVLILKTKMTHLMMRKPIRLII